MDRPDQHPVPRRGETHRSPWASPAMAGALALVVLVLSGAIVIGPGLVPSESGSPSASLAPAWTLAPVPGVIVDGANPPIGSPLPTGGATGGGSPATVISNGPRGTTMVAPTFHMGGPADPAGGIGTRL